MTLETAENPIELRLLALRREVMAMIEEKGVPGLEKEIGTTIDNFMGSQLLNDLNGTFGDCGFKVSMRNLFKHSMGGGKLNDGNYKYLIEHISWSWGPNPHQLFFYLVENYKHLLQSYTDYNETMFTRRMQGIEKQYMSYFIPHEIGGKHYNALQVWLTKTENRINDKATNIYWSVNVKDKKLGIGQLRGETLDELFARLQKRLEDIVYMPVYSQAYKQFYLYEKPKNKLQVALDQKDGNGEYHERDDEDSSISIP